VRRVKARQEVLGQEKPKVSAGRTEVHNIFAKMFMAPVMLCAALVPIGAILFVQAEHDTRGFTEVPSPDEALAEQIRKQNQMNGINPRPEYAGTRSQELLRGPGYNLVSRPDIR
jgi:hypothetical protein